MATTRTSLSLPSLDIETYRIRDISRILTPALAIYPEIVDHNIETTLRLLGSDASRWRPHVKTAKLEFVMTRYLDHHVEHFKCSTSLELLTLCRIGAPDVLIAYPLVGANARRVNELADQFPHTRVSALVETIEQADAWTGSRVSLFIDVNPGMDRTGIQQQELSRIVELAEHIVAAGSDFRGLHYYDGHLGSLELKERTSVAHKGYDRLLNVINQIEDHGPRVEEVITAGTPAFPCTLSYSSFAKATFAHRASPGTVIYGDCSSLGQLPTTWGYQPAAVVISTVVSHPSPDRITCDAGHKTVSADAGSPTCAIIGRPDLNPTKPSEEHLPMDVHGLARPEIGETLYLVPRHVCPTINNFDHALLVNAGRVVGTQSVTARGREFPLRDP
jgi:D-serine deaminase-like pyridoxal phosphate-dependent protein